MAARTFTVFQDAVSVEVPQKSKTSRSGAMVTRSISRNAANLAIDATASAEPITIDKENYNPVTGERAGPSNNVNKKRKTVLVTKVQPTPLAAKGKKEKEAQSVEPEAKKRKASTASTARPKVKKDVKVKGSGSASISKKGTAKRTSSKKVSPLPKVNEEEEVQKDSLTQADIDSRCYELTVKPLADVSEAYNELDVFRELTGPPTTFDEVVVTEDKFKFRMVKASSVEPEIRDYFQSSQAQLCSSTVSRFRAFSEGPSEPRTFSTPERKQIYAAFTFSSPSGPSARLNFGNAFSAGSSSTTLPVEAEQPVTSDPETVSQ